MTHKYHNEQPQLDDEALLSAYRDTGAKTHFEDLYTRHVSALRRTAGIALGTTRHSPDNDVVEELVEQVFLKLHRKRRNLAGFDPSRWSFPTFLSLLLRDELRIYWRKFRHRDQVTILFTDQILSQHANNDTDTTIFLSEFSSKLRGSEQRYWNEVVQQQPPPINKQPLLTENCKKLRQRLINRFNAYWTDKNPAKTTPEKTTNNTSNLNQSCPQT